MFIENDYDDFNYYCRFITSQIEWRKKIMNIHDLKYHNRDEIIKDYSIINASGIRSSGATTAILNLFNPDKDLYIGINKGMCEQFEKNLKAVREPFKQFNYLNFNMINFDNTNIDKNDLQEKIESFFENNDLEVMQMKITQKGFGKTSRSFEQVDLKQLKKDISKELIYGSSDTILGVDKLVGKFQKLKEAIVYIDIGAATHRKYGIRVNRLIDYISKYYSNNCQLIFVLT